MADGTFINTTGVGRIMVPIAVEPPSVRPGDAVILSDDIGRHRRGVMAAGYGFDCETVIESDCSPFAAPVLALVDVSDGLHCLRDLTWGRLASALVEIAETAGVAIKVKEQVIPVGDDVGSACDLLGLDPLHVANGGRFAAFVAPKDGRLVVEILRQHEVSRDAVVTGEVCADSQGQVSSRGIPGPCRTIDMLSGEQLPRIC